MRAVIRDRVGVLLAVLALGGCKAKETPSGPPASTIGALDTSEFTGKCKVMLENVAQVTAPTGTPVADQIKARVAAKVDAKRCQKAAMPEEEITCLIGAKTREEIGACRAKK